jgi:integrase/recombinase XerC
MATPDDMIDAHIAWMRAGNYADTTIGYADKLLRRLHRELPYGLHNADETDLVKWLSADPTWSGWTPSNYHKTIVRFYRWSVRPSDPWLSFDPSAGLIRPRPPKRVPNPAPKTLQERAVTEPTMPWLLHCRLAAYAGMRPYEIATIRRENISREWIHIRGKGNKERVVPTHPAIWGLVEPLPDGPISAGTAYWVSRETARYLRKHGIDLTLYRLRHWFGTELASKYRNMRVVQELMGHASLNDTQGYAAVTNTQLAEAIACLISGEGAGDAAPSRSPQSAPRSSESAPVVGGTGRGQRSRRRASRGMLRSGQHARP